MSARRDLLEPLRDRALDMLTAVCRGFYAELPGHLLDRASDLGAGEEHQRYYDAYTLTNQCGRAMLARCMQQLERGLDLSRSIAAEAFTQPAGDIPAGSLDLLDARVFEDRLASDRLVGSLANRYASLLESLTIRYADVAGQDALDFRLPVHPRAVCGALLSSLVESETLHGLVPDILDLFEKIADKQLGDCYRTLNGFLRGEGVRPELDKRLDAEGSILEPLRAKQRRAAPSATPVDNDGASRDTPSNHAEDAAEARQGVALRAVIDALACQRGLDEHSAAAPAGAGQLADRATLLRALAQLQQDVEAQQHMGQPPELGAYLSANRERLDALAGTGGLAIEVQVQVDLVDTLFRTLACDLQLLPAMESALHRLQLPLARVALNEPELFTRRDHPTRKLINGMAQLAGAANYPNRPLERRLSGIVAGLEHAREDDHALFQSALGQVAALVQQQQQAVARNVERVVRTLEGQQTLQEAQDAVAEALRRYLGPPAAPAVLMDLVDNGWRDLLVLTRITLGDDSDAWREQIEVLARLTRWLAGDAPPAAGNRVEVERALEAETLVDWIGQRISSAAPTSITCRPVLERLRASLLGEEPVAMVDIPEVGPGLATAERLRRNKIDSLPRLRRWMRRVDTLEPGCWLSGAGEAGAGEQVQLAWISRARDRYVLVNARGQKCADLSPVALARRLAHGWQPLLPADRLDPMDRSLYETLSRVQRSICRERFHDAATGLLNEAGLQLLLERSLRGGRPRGRGTALLLLQVEHEGRASPAGDALQIDCAAARCLERTARPQQRWSRLGRGEFGLLLEHGDRQEALKQAEHWRNTATAVPGVAAVCAGIAALDAEADPHDPQQDLVAAARRALAEDRQAGRQRAALAPMAANEHGTWARRIEEYLAQGRLVLNAQPIVCASHGGSTEEGNHYEVLLGLLDERGEPTSPQGLIIAAEHAGCMVRLDRWVVEQVSHWLCRLRDEGVPMPRLSVNLSGNSVSDDAFLEFLLHHIDERALPTDCLCFEITETGTISDLVRAADFVRALKRLGCRFSIDDFGTGMASYNYLKQLPVDYVKIDGSFVTDINRNPRDYYMAKSINDLAQFLGQQTIAECVEDEATAETLRELGVDYLQGWCFGHPRSLRGLGEELRGAARSA